MAPSGNGARDCAHRRQASGALHFLQDAIDVDPLAEESQRTRMLFLQESGEGAAALRIYHRCRGMLAAALGVKPSAATEAIRRVIVADIGEDSPDSPRDDALGRS